MRWFVLLLLTTTNAYAGSITPRFTSGQLEQSSRSVSTIQETIITENYRTGFSYTVQGHNIKTDSYISPDATYTTSQNTGNGAVNFQWVTPELTSKPQWTIVDEGSDFSLVENFLAPGLDAVSVINRTQTIETQSTSLSIFSQ
nr:gp166 [uncultured Mediterranean phage uvMED]